jgi:hypothetical protein
MKVKVQNRILTPVQNDILVALNLFGRLIYAWDLVWHLKLRSVKRIQ